MFQIFSAYVVSALSFKPSMIHLPAIAASADFHKSCYKKTDVPFLLHPFPKNGPYPQ